MDKERLVKKGRSHAILVYDGEAPLAGASMGLATSSHAWT